MLEETEKIEAYLKTHCGGRIRAAYGCSLGGSFVGLLAARQNIHMDYGILGSSDLDQASPLAASLQTDFLLPLIHNVPGGHVGFIVQAERYLDLMETFLQRNGI